MRFICWSACLALLVLCTCSIDCWRPSRQTKQQVVHAQIANFHTALGAYRQDVGDYPSDAEGLQALRVNPGRRGWDGPYLPLDIPLDPWGQPATGLVSLAGQATLALLGGAALTPLVVYLFVANVYIYLNLKYEVDLASRAKR